MDHPETARPEPPQQRGPVSPIIGIRLAKHRTQTDPPNAVRAGHC
jgi:hypothetical protein